MLILDPLGNRTAELVYWINERELMRQRKEHDQSRWKHGYHDDPHIGSVRYCNVRREDDKVTNWLAHHWRPKYSAVWQILLARLINNIPTLEMLLPFADASLDTIRSLLKTRRSNHYTIFGNAYTVSTNGRSMDKVDYIIDHVVKPAKERPHMVADTLAGMCSLLCTLNGVSTFMAGQIIADLKNTAGHPLADAPDWWDWAAPGPGSLRGLEAYYRCKITPSKFADDLRRCYNEAVPHLGGHVPRLHMQDFQNCMCEFSKYIRVKGGGHVRNRYAPRVAG